MRKLVHLTLFLFVTLTTAKAADKYWVGNNDNFQQNGNWSLTPGGPGGAGSPGANDVAVFDIASNGFSSLVTINGGQTFQGIRIAGFEGIIVLTGNGNKNLTGFLSTGLLSSIVMSSGIMQVQGTLNASGDINMTGGIIQLGNSSTTTLNGSLIVDFDNGAILQGNTPVVGQTGSTVIFNNERATPALVIGNGSGTTGINLYNVTINNIAPGSDETLISFSDVMQVRGTLTLQNGRVNGLGVGSTVGKIRAIGNIVAGAGFLPSNAQLEFAGNTNQTVTFNAAVQGNWNGNILFNKSGNPTGTVTLNSPILFDQLGQTVTFTSGVVNTTQTNLMIFTDGVTAIGQSNSSYVDGPVQKSGISGFTFPVGDAGFWGGISISGATTFESPFASSVTHVAQYFRVNPDLAGYPHTSLSPFAIANNFKVSECEYWNMQRTAGTADPVIWLSFDNARSCGITAPNNLAVMAWIPPLTSYWEATGGVFTGSPVNFRRSIGPVNFISGIYTLGTNNPIANPLPVRWLSFTGRYFNAAVELNWSTSLEQNNDMFTVERSSDGINYSAIGTVKGKGNASTTSVYNFVDPRPLSGTGHYRIKQTDRDGKISYSDVIRVSSSSPSMRGLRLFPNPAAGNIPLTLENSSWTNKKVNVTIFNAVGGIVYQDQVTFGADGRSKVNISSLQKGSYFVSTFLNGEKQTMPFLVQ